MKLGFVAEQDRLPDSPDTVVPEEPTIGSIVRSKGNLYLLVTGRTAGARLRELTRLVSDTIRREYYYDESAGIVVCLEKAIKAANKKLGHQKDRLGGDETNGPIGVAAAVVRGNELYVVTVGPAEAYLIRQARLSTLPDPHRERGLPTTEIEPDVWRGEISVGDSVVLASPNLVGRLGPDELKDAMVTLHPQSAMEHLHHRFIAADGTGSDGAIAFEATEVSATAKQRKLVPVKPAEPLAGSPDRSPIPLADSVTAGAAAVQQSARQAKTAAGGAAGRFLGGIQDRLPRRSGPADRRVTTLSSRRETQRRAAVAVLALIIVVGLLGSGVWYLGGGSGSTTGLTSLTAGQKALMDAKTAIEEVYAPGINLVKNDPPRATELLTKAWRQLETAGGAGIPASAIDPLRAQAQAGLDELYKMDSVGATTLFSFADSDPPVDLQAVVLGPDKAPYVLDAATNAVYRVDVKGGKAAPVAKVGQAVGGIKVAEPKFIAPAGPDLLILDSQERRCGAGDRPTRRARDPGQGQGQGIVELGRRHPGDRCVRPERRPGALQPVRRRSVGQADPGLHAGLRRRRIPGRPERLAGRAPGRGDGRGDGHRRRHLPVAVGDDQPLRPRRQHRLEARRPGRWAAPAGSGLLARRDRRRQVDRRDAYVYGYDKANQRVLALSKDNGSVVGQYRLAGDAPGWSDLRGMYILAGTETEPDTLVWIDKNRLMSSILEGVKAPTASPSPSGGASPSTSPKASPKPTKKPKKTPKP